MFDLSNYLRRITDHDCICRNIPGDNGPSANHGVPSYPYPREENSSATNPYIIFDCDCLCYFPPLIPCFCH